MEIPISLQGPTNIDLSSSFQASALASSSTTSSLLLSHLPPLKVRLALPSTYPLEQPPKIISIRAPLPASTGAWLSKRTLAQVQDKISQMWTDDKEMTGEGSAVVWKWWEWIGSGEFLVDLGMMKNGVLQ